MVKKAKDFAVNKHKRVKKKRTNSIAIVVSMVQNEVRARKEVLK